MPPMDVVSTSMKNTERDHEKWNEEMAIRHNPDDFINRTGFVVRWMEALRIKKSISILNCGPDDVVLDLGCGSGNLTEKLKGKTIIGVDLSDFLIQRAKDRCLKNPNIQIKKGNAENLDFEDSYFSKVICSEVLEHVKDPAGALIEMHRITAPGGRIVITVPNEELINLTKKYVLRFGLKKWVAGKYNMSDNMLDEWHVSEITKEWIHDHLDDRFTLDRTLAIPTALFPYHRAFILTVNK